MRAKRRRNHHATARFLTVTAAALSLPVLIHVVSLNAGWLGRAGQNAAIFSAAIAMPDSSIDLLKDRFQAEIYDPDAEHRPLVPVPEQADPLPVVPQGEEDWNDNPPAEEGAGDGATETSDSAKPPAIPKKYQAPLVSENFYPSDTTDFVRFGAGLIKNETTEEDEDLEALLETPVRLGLTDTGEPQVLIVHTHATESFERYDSTIYDIRNTWRSTDNSRNMVAVGNAMEQVLTDNGIGVIHDTTQHDYPSYNGSYDRSAKTIKAYLEEYPSIKIVLDLHRDAMQRDDAIVKPVVSIDGQKAAQIMIISACDDGDMDIPDWEENLRFAALYQDYMEMLYPQLTRPVYLCYRKYNMDLTTGSLLLEIGSNANTLDEAVYSAQMAGEALSQLILEHAEALE